MLTRSTAAAQAAAAQAAAAQAAAPLDTREQPALERTEAAVTAEDGSFNCCKKIADFFGGILSGIRSLLQRVFPCLPCWKPETAVADTVARAALGAEGSTPSAETPAA